jgi:hypothetical protein
LARKPNYNFEKRRKELERKQKREDKALRKRENATPSATEPASTVDGPESPAENRDVGRSPE